jgi:hypothetical protein
MKQLVREVIELSYTLSGVNKATIRAVGNVPTGGWTNGELTDSGGFRFDFLAEPPSGMAAQHISLVTASTTVPLLGQEIVVRSDTNEKSLQLPQQGDQP